MQQGLGKGWMMIAAGVIVMLLIFVSKDSFAANMFSLDTKNMEIGKSFEAKDFSSILVDADSTDVKLVRGTSEEIQVRLAGKVSSEIADQARLQAEPQADTLKVKVELAGEFQMGTRFSDLELTVELPARQWENVKILAGNGNVDARQLDGKNVDIQARSGDITVKEVQSNQISLQASSGHITAERFASDVLSFHAESGDVRLSRGQAAIKGETSSGAIQLILDELLKPADLQTGSGDVAVHLAREPKSASVDYRGGSGAGKIKWEGVSYKEKSEKADVLKGVFGDGGIELKVRTGSGNFTMGQE